ncbi:MAG: hypothetical protein AAB925_01010 [Patescibacteria group bacterium]
MDKVIGYHKLREESPELKIREMGNTARLWYNVHPERCINNYARLGPEDDFSESMVAALRKPEILDGERLRFIKEKFLAEK